MKQFTEFMDKYFIYIWLVMALTIVSIFFIRGRKAIQLFSDLDLSNLVYSEKNATGYSTKSFRTRWGGSSKILHIMITNKELIIKTYLFMAYIAEKHDMLHRIPLENILKTQIKKGVLFSRLFIEFKGQNGETKEIVLMSKNNDQIKEILDSYIL
jgi:hypothetical protein